MRAYRLTLLEAFAEATSRAPTRGNYKDEGDKGRLCGRMVVRKRERELHVRPSASQVSGYQQLIQFMTKRSYTPPRHTTLRL